MEKILFTISITLLLANLISSQLTKSDLTRIKSIIYEQRDAKTGLFSDSDDSVNLIAVESAKLLSEDINKKSFCRELDLSKEEPTYSRVRLNALLNCEIKFIVTKELQEKPFSLLDESNDILELRKNIITLESLGITIDAGKLHEKIKNYRTKLILYSLQENSGVVSVTATAEALKLLSFILEKTTDDTTREDIRKEVIILVKEMNAFIQILGQDIAAYTELSTDTITLNSSVLEAFESIRKLVNNDTSDAIDAISFQVMNFFMKYKYNITTLSKVNAFLKGISHLATYPVFQVQKHTIFVDDIEERAIPFKITNIFGKEDSTYDVEIRYTKDSENNDAKALSSDSTDLPDEDLDLDTEKAQEKQVRVSNSSEGRLTFEEVKTIGKYAYNLVVTCRSNSGQGLVRVFSRRVEFRAISKLKIAYLNVNVSNTSEKADGKDSKVEFPKRSFRNIKATQNSVIQVKVKMNTSSIRMEQFFLKLKHNELSKGATGYCNEYNALEGYHILSLDLSDHSVIEAYDGVYEMSIVLSDPGMENPIIWNFGKIDIKFSKPMDPLSINESYKNPQKPKMEHTNAVEKHTKTSLASPVFSAAIIVITIIYLKYLTSTGINMDNFPKKNKTMGIVAFLFIITIGLYVYFLFLFWIKFNILQTFGMLLLTGIPGTLIVFKTVVNVQIDL